MPSVKPGTAPGLPATQEWTLWTWGSHPPGEQMSPLESVVDQPSECHRARGAQAGQPLGPWKGCLPPSPIAGPDQVGEPLPPSNGVWLHTWGGGWKKLWLKTTNNLGHQPRWGAGDTPEGRGAHHHQDPPKPGTWPQAAFEE